MSVSRDWGADVFRFAPRRARGAGRARQARLGGSEVEGSTFRKLRTSNSPQSSLLQTAELPCEKITGCLHVVRDIGL